MTKDVMNGIMVDASRIATMLSLAVLIWLGATVNSLSVDLAVLTVKMDTYVTQVDELSKRLEELSKIVNERQ